MKVQFLFSGTVTVPKFGCTSDIQRAQRTNFAKFLIYTGIANFTDINAIKILNWFLGLYILNAIFAFSVYAQLELVRAYTNSALYDLSHVTFGEHRVYPTLKDISLDLNSKSESISTILGEQNPAQSESNSSPISSLAAGFKGNPQTLAPYSSALTKDEADHFLWHTSFGATVAERSQLMNAGLTSYINVMFQERDASQVETLARRIISNTNNNNQPTMETSSAYWMFHMRHSPNRFREFMAFTLHDLLATSCGTSAFIIAGEKCFEHLERLRNHAFGNYKSLLREMMTDFVMLHWLNGKDNKVGGPDENHARELLELHTIGERYKTQKLYPNEPLLYTPEDIAEIARALTGWQAGWMITNPNTGIRATQVYFDASLHDSGVKTLWRGTPYEVSGNFNANDIIDILFDKRRRDIGRFIGRRMFTALVHDHPSPALIEELADELINSGFVLEPVLRKILHSEAMFSTDAQLNRVKNPLTFLIGLYSRLDIPRMYSNYFSRALGVAGLELLDPPGVEGWPINKFGEHYKSDFYLSQLHHYGNLVMHSLNEADQLFVNSKYKDFIHTVHPNGQNFSWNNLLPNIRSMKAAQVVDGVSDKLGLLLSAEERDLLISYLDNDRSGGSEVYIPFETSSDTRFRRKILSFVAMIARTRVFLTY